MRRYGARKTTARVEGHQDCAICHQENKPLDRAERRRERRLIAEESPGESMDEIRREVAADSE